MRRHEAVALVVAALILTIAGVVWLFGPYGLLGSGVVLLFLALFVIDVKEHRATVADARTRART